MHDLLRFFKVQVVGQLVAWKTPVEHRKVAVYHNRRMAVCHSLLHVAPLSAAIALLVLNWSQYFVGVELSQATTLQFVAKFHELLMQTSIAEVIICIVRLQTVDGYVPLGFLSAAMQTFQLSYIWSLDFVSAVTSQVLHGWRKAVFALTIPLLIFLGALVGPSSAVLMIPRPGLSESIESATRYVNDSLDSLFPSHVNKSHYFKM